jgi:hypothetical protein
LTITAAATGATTVGAVGVPEGLGVVAAVVVDELDVDCELDPPELDVLDEAGGAEPATVISWVTAALSPSTSVTVSVIL